MEYVSSVAFGSGWEGSGGMDDGPDAAHVVATGGAGVVEVRRVAVSGARAGTAPLTWGQRSILRAAQWLGEDAGYYNMSYRVAVPAGAGVSEVVDALRTVLLRHAALRTRFVDDGGDVRQVVDDAGAVVLELYRVARGAVARTVQALFERRQSIVFRRASDWPLRAQLVVGPDGPAVLLVVLNHIAVDGAGALLLVAELERLLAGQAPDDVAEVGSPLDIAAEEGTPSLRQRHARTVDRWRRTLADAPATAFGHPPFPADQPRFRALTMASEAVTLAVARIVARQRVSGSAVLCTAWAQVLGQATGNTDIAQQIIVHNRFDVRRRRMVGVFAQPGLLRVDLAGRSFDEAVGAMLAAMLEAYRSGYYEPEEIRRLLADLARKRGTPVDLSVYFNDVRPADDRSFAGRRVPAEATEQRLVELSRQTTIVDSGGWPRIDATCFVTTGRQDRATTVQLQADTAYVPLAEMRRMLLGMERLLVRAAIGDVSADDVGPVTGVRPLAGLPRV